MVENKEVKKDEFNGDAFFKATSQIVGGTYAHVA